MSDFDVIDEVLAISPGDRLDEIRAARPAARENAQRSFDALFSPVDDSRVSIIERHAIAAFVAGVSRESLLRDYYSGGLESEPGIAAEVNALVDTAATTGPFGRYREAGLAGESTDGYRLVIADETAARLGLRLSSALRHAHLLVFRPREASSDSLQVLLDAGWSVDGIVTVSQLVAFVSFQLRIVIGLGALAAHLDDPVEAESAPADQDGTE